MSVPPPRGAAEENYSNCGSIINTTAEMCRQSGVGQQPPAAITAGSTPRGGNRVVAALFALLLGGVGIHKFYLGRVGQGILYMLFFWTFIPAIVGFVEGIIYLTMSDQDFEKKYG